MASEDNVFHDLGFAEPEAQNLLLRADLVAHIRKVITKLGITQAEAAQRAGVSQPRMNDLVKGRTHKFTACSCPQFDEGHTQETGRGFWRRFCHLAANVQPGATRAVCAIGSHTAISTSIWVWCGTRCKQRCHRW